MNVNPMQVGRCHSFFRTKSILLLGLGFAIPSVSWGMNPTDLFREPTTTPRVQEAYQQILNANEEIRDLFNRNSLHTLSFSQEVTGPGHVETTKFQHYYKGIEVIGSMAFYHSGVRGVAIRDHIARFDLNTTPQLDVQTVASLVQGITGSSELKSLPTLRILPSPSQNAARLIYWAEVKPTPWGGGRDILIDAHSGKLIANISHEYSIAPIQIYSGQNQGIKIVPTLTQNADPNNAHIKNCQLIDLSTGAAHTIPSRSCTSLYQGQSNDVQGHCQLIDGNSDSPMEGIPLAIDAASCSHVVTNSVLVDTSDSSVVHAVNNSTQVLNYYQNHFGRNSFDNQGSDLVSVIHAGDHLDNAFWVVDLNVMVYGDGDGKIMGDLTQSVDVAGHEMTHGVTGHTAKLLMMGESGALNEAFSDFFGKIIENKGDWVIGRNLFIGPNAPKGIRDLANPGSLQDEVLDSQGNPVQKPYPAQLSEAATVDPSQSCDAYNDNCWVHYNSTIPSHASYLVFQALGQSKAELLYYTTLTQNLTASDDLHSAAKAVLSTCNQLGFTSDDCNAVQGAYVQVGLM